MGTIEQQQKIDYSERIITNPGKAVLGALNALDFALITPKIENIIVKTDIEYVEGFGDEYIRAINAGYRRPILIANHASIIDAMFSGLPARDLKNVANEILSPDQQLQNFALILAASLHYGYQGPWLKGFYDATTPLLEKYGISPFLVVRSQDRDRYQMHPNYEQTHDDLVLAVKNGHPLIVLPEGTTRGQGMNKFMHNSIITMISAVEEAGEKALVIPVSTSGGDKIQNSNSKLPTWLAFKSGFNINNDHPVKVHVGHPLRYDEGELGDLYSRKRGTGINKLVGGLIAKQLLPEERGIYA